MVRKKEKAAHERMQRAGAAPINPKSTGLLTLRPEELHSRKARKDEEETAPMMFDEDLDDEELDDLDDDEEDDEDVDDD